MYSKKRLRVSALFLIFFFLSFATAFSQPVYEWAKKIGASGIDYSTAQLVDALGNTYVCGKFTGTVDFDPSASTANLVSTGPYGDLFIAKYNTSGNYLWAKRLGGNGDGSISTIIFDPSGNLFVSGYYYGTIDFNPSTSVANLTSVSGPGGADAFLGKYDMNGNYLWVKSFGGVDYEYIYSASIDNSGNIYLTGSIGGTVDVDPSANIVNLTALGLLDIFFGKYDANGNCLWAKNLGNPGGTTTSLIGNTIKLNSSGNLILMGGYNGTVDFDPSSGVASLTTTNQTCFFAQYSSASGAFNWVKEIRGSSSATDLMLDNSGNILLAGNFTGTVDFDPSATVVNLTAAGSDGFFAKYDAAGSFLWAKKIGGTSSDGVTALSMDNSYYYLTGTFSGTADMDPSASTANLVSSGSNDIFMSRYDFTGNYSWASKVGGSLSESSKDLIMQSGNLYMVGYFNGTADFNPSAAIANLVSSGSYDAFVSKYSICIAPDNAGTISGNFTPCLNTIQTYSIAAVANATSYTWSIPSFASIVSGQGTNSITVQFNNTGNGAISVTPSNNCANGISNLAGITVLTLPNGPIGSISGPSSTCLGSSQTFSIAPVTGATGYTWVVPSGNVIQNGQGTTSINVQLSGSNGNVTVNAFNSCGTLSASRSLIITNVPSGTGTISGNNPVCEGTTNTYVSSTVPANTTGYTWSAPAGCTLLSSQGTANMSILFGSTGGNISITPYNTCGTGTPYSMAVTVNNIPSAIGVISGIFNVTQGTSGLVYSIAPVAGATSYNWVVPSGSSIVNGQGTTSITVNAGSISGNISVTATNGCGSVMKEQFMTIYTCPEKLLYNSTSHLNLLNSSINGSGTVAYLETDVSGNIYVLGSYDGTVDIDITASTYTITSINTTDMYLAKYSSTGALLWVNTFGGIGEQIGFALELDLNGNAYIAGRFQNTVDLDPGASVYNLTAATNQDLFVAKYTSTGNFSWATKIEVNYYDELKGLAINSSGEAVIVGTSANSGNNPVGIFFSKINNIGTWQWTNVVNNAFNDWTYSGSLVTLDNAGNIYLTGSFAGTFDFDPSASIYTLSPASIGMYDVYLAKYSSAGSFQWANAIGGNGRDVGYSITSDNNNLYITGFFSGTVDFDPSLGTTNLTSMGNGDIYLAKYDFSGNLIWAKAMGGNSTIDNDIGVDFEVDASGSIYLTGQFLETVDFDPGVGTANLTSTSGSTLQDIFIAKYSSLGEYVWAKKIGSVDGEFPADIDIKNGEIYLTGNFSSTLDFDPTAGIANLTPSLDGTADVFIAKYIECNGTGLRGADNIFESMELSVTSDNSNWTLYPNPGNEEVLINSSFSSVVEYEICELSGVSLQKGFVSGSGLQYISTAKIPSGTYLVKLGNKTIGYTYKKLVVVH